MYSQVKLVAQFDLFNLPDSNQFVETVMAAEKEIKKNNGKNIVSAAKSPTTSDKELTIFEFDQWCKSENLSFSIDSQRIGSRDEFVGKLVCNNIQKIKITIEGLPSLKSTIFSLHQTWNCIKNNG